VPLKQTPIYMRYLLRRFERRGGTIRREEVTDLAALCTRHSLVVNCSGVWAQTLVGDEQVYPIRGQVIRVSTNDGPNGPLSSVGLFHEPEDAQPTYAFPRSDGVILGGTVDEGQWQTVPDHATTADIVARVRRLVPEAGSLNVLDAQAGLRPGRREVRLDVERIGSTTVIHNYGHGGAGFTLSWGCADEVAARAGQVA
jgi:D-amino-acid oxidase